MTVKKLKQELEELSEYYDDFQVRILGATLDIMIAEWNEITEIQAYDDLGYIELTGEPVD